MYVKYENVQKGVLKTCKNKKGLKHFRTNWVWLYIEAWSQFIN